MTPPRPSTLGKGGARALRSCESYLDLVVLADGHGAHVVFLSQLLGERGRHDLPAHVRGGIEVAFAIFAAVRGHEGVELHGDRLQKVAREGAKGRSVGCRDTPPISPPPRASALREEVASESD